MMKVIKRCYNVGKSEIWVNIFFIQDPLVGLGLGKVSVLPVSKYVIRFNQISQVHKYMDSDMIVF